MEKPLTTRKPVISIIIPTFNCMRYLKECLDSVQAAMREYGNAELILIDNGSTDGTCEFLNSNLGGSAKIFRIEGVTISALRNHGASVAKGELLSFIDSDCVIPPDYLDQAVNVFSSIETDAAGNYYDLPPNSGWVQDTWFNLTRRTSDKFVPYLFSGNLMVKATAFRSVGGFDESLMTGEDAEFGIRLNKQGYRIYATPQIPALHLGIQRNLAEFFRKNTWHALGMFGSVGSAWLDKPLVMTLAHLLLSIAGLVNLFFNFMGIVPRIAAALLLPLAVPAMAAAYRMAKGRKIYRPVRSTILYFVYFAARANALCRLAFGQGRKSKTVTGKQD